jgi:hypothetical protein
MPITEMLKKLRSSQRTKRTFSSCGPCNDAINDVGIHFKHLENNIEATRNMQKDRSYSIIMEDGISYTTDDINAKINREKCWIEYHLERYRRCCKDGKLPEIEKFKC